MCMFVEVYIRMLKVTKYNFLSSYVKLSVEYRHLRTIAAVFL